MIILKDGKPFEGEPNLSSERVKEIIAAGLWTEKELEDRGLVVCDSFVAPEGKITTGEPRYTETEDGVWVEEYDVVDAPPPPPKPTREEQFYLTTGFRIEELKQLLGLA